MFFHWLKHYGKANRHATMVVDGIFADAKAASPAVFEADSSVRTLQQAKFEHMCPWAAFHLLDKSEAESRSVMEELVDRLEIGLREGGVGDMKVGVHVRKFAAALHGRIRRYASVLEAKDWAGLKLALEEHGVDAALAKILKEKSTKKAA